MGLAQTSDSLEAGTLRWISPPKDPFEPNKHVPFSVDHMSSVVYVTDHASKAAQIKAGICANSTMLHIISGIRVCHFPTYGIHKDLQDRNKVSMGSTRSWQGVFVGHCKSYLITLCDRLIMTVSLKPRTTLLHSCLQTWSSQVVLHDHQLPYPCVSPCTGLEPLLDLNYPPIHKQCRAVSQPKRGLQEDSGNIRKKALGYGYYGHGSESRTITPSSFHPFIFQLHYFGKLCWC